MLQRLLKLFRQTPDTGHWGEGLAAKYLRKEKGFRIVEVNWRAGRDEIDLIAWDEKILVFVEVKTRKASALVKGYHAVDTRKRRALQRVMRAYLKTLAKKPITWRLDVVEVNYESRDRYEVLHFPQVPELDGYSNWAKL